MAKRIIRLTEADIEKIVLRVIEEQLVSVGKTEGQDYESRVYDTNHSAFQKWLNGIKYLLGTYEERTGVAPDYNAMVRRKAGLSTLRFNKDSKQYVETPIENNTKLFEQKANRLMKFMDDTSKQVAQRAIEKSYPYWVWVVNTKANELMGLLKGKKNASVVMDDMESVREVPMPKPEVNMPEVAMDDKNIPLDSKFDTGSPELKPSYKSELPEILKKGFSDAVNQFRKQYSEIEFPGPVYVGSIQVFSSSSRVPQDNMKDERYRTGKNGTPDGYKNLSEDRGKALQEYILSFIKSDKSIVTDGNTKVLDMNFLGQNGDGTSGPEWDQSKGSQHQDYLNAQYAYVVITFTAIPQPTTPPPVEPKDINDFSIRSSAEGRSRFFININIPKLNLPEVNLGGVRLFSTGKDLSCAVWGPSKGYSGFGF